MIGLFYRPLFSYFCEYCCWNLFCVRAVCAGPPCRACAERSSLTQNRFQQQDSQKYENSEVGMEGRTEKGELNIQEWSKGSSSLWRAFRGPLEGRQERVNLTFNRRKAHTGTVGLDSCFFIISHSDNWLVQQKLPWITHSLTHLKEWDLT